jgi:hypothetical protein
MHAEHAAGSFLGEIINRTPKAGQIKIVLMKANNKQIGTFTSALRQDPNTGEWFERDQEKRNGIPLRRVLIHRFERGSSATVQMKHKGLATLQLHGDPCVRDLFS